LERRPCTLCELERFVPASGEVVEAALVVEHPGETIEVAELFVDLGRPSRVDRLVQPPERHVCPVEDEVGVREGVLRARPLRLGDSAMAQLDRILRTPLVLPYCRVPAEEPRALSRGGNRVDVLQ